jgi:SAM-dependent methyltransferase
VSETLFESSRFWDAHAVRDPLWAVLSDADKANRGWDVQRFFATGVNELRQLFYDLEVLGIQGGRQSALDFGCGVGRLSQALAEYFDRVVGVDVSARMVDVAAQLNRHATTVSYICNEEPHLRIFPSGVFDFTYSNLVLQHIAPALTIGYVKEFFRVTRPGGLVVFQLPSHRRVPQQAVEAAGPSGMPEHAYRASISLAARPPARLRPGDSASLLVDVANISGYPWSQQRHGVLRVGNHWLTDVAPPRLLLQDDGRSALPELVHPGESCRVSLVVTAPVVAGAYLCELDLAHEGVRWFHDLGSAVVRFQIAVAEPHAEDPAERLPSPDRHDPKNQPPPTHSLAAPGDLTAPDPGGFPMFGIDANTVAQLIRDEGAQLLNRLDDHSCGREWVSYRYVARNPITRGE